MSALLARRRFNYECVWCTGDDEWPSMVTLDDYSVPGGTVTECCACGATQFSTAAMTFRAMRFMQSSRLRD